MGAQISDMAGAMCNSMDENETSRGSLGCEGVHKREANRRSVQEEEVSAQQLVNTFSSPMHAAALLGTAADISALAAAGHEYEGRDKVGRTPCHLAAISGNVKNLQALVELGAHLEVEDYRGSTPLQSAAQSHRPQVVKWIKWRIWSEQGKFREGGFEHPRSAAPRDATACPGQGGPSVRDGFDIHSSRDGSTSASESGSITYGIALTSSRISHSITKSPRNNSNLNCTVAHSIPSAPGSRPLRSVCKAQGVHNAAITDTHQNLPPAQVFAWEGAQLNSQIRRLAGILKIMFPDLDVGEDELRILMYRSGDDMVRAVALAQDRYKSADLHEGGRR